MRIKALITERIKQPRQRVKTVGKRELISWFFLLPSLIGVFVFFVAPFMVIIAYSFMNNPVQKEFVGFSNFVNVWNNEAFRKAGLNTLNFSFTAVPLAVVLSLILAAVMESRIPFKSFFRSSFLSPLMVPTASIVLIWQVMFHQNGIVNNVLATLGDTSKTDWLKSDKAYVVLLTLFLWKNLGYNMILFMSALGGIPKELIEVARIESAGKFQIFWHVKLRFISPTIMFVTIMSLINSFKVFREIYLLTGDYPYDTLYMLQHYMNNKFASLDYQMLSSAAIIMFIIVSILIYFLLKFEDSYGKDVEG